MGPMSIDALKTEIAREFGTPAVVIDLDRVERNIARVQALCDKAGVANRPHIKTHKSPVLAKMQVAAGAKGITCQKLGEAEVMVDGGLDDILISYNLLGEEKMARLGALSRRAAITVAADNPTVIADLPKAAEVAGRPLGVVIECDTGRKRAGVETAKEAIELARLIKERPTLRFEGFLFYPTETSWPQTQKFFNDAARGLKELGLSARVVSTGGTPNLPNMGKLEGATEHRAGTYIFNDRMMLACGAATPEDCALNVFTTVVSRAAPERGILDAGAKTLTADTGALDDGFGLILEYPQAKIKAFAEEHGFLDLSRSNDRPKVGDVVRVVPNHVCVVVNMVDRMIAVRGDKIVDVLPVAARGRLT
jgi:D-serine deaminase-like pyridoxal phosphate-dependent protein